MPSGFIIQGDAHVDPHRNVRRHAVNGAARQPGACQRASARFAADAEAVQKVLQEAGISPSATSEQNQIPPEALTNRAADMTVLVSCWE